VRFRDAGDFTGSQRRGSRVSPTRPSPRQVVAKFISRSPRRRFRTSDADFTAFGAKRVHGPHLSGRPSCSLSRSRRRYPCHLARGRLRTTCRSAGRPPRRLTAVRSRSMNISPTGSVLFGKPIIQGISNTPCLSQSEIQAPTYAQVQTLATSSTSSSAPISARRIPSCSSSRLHQRLHRRACDVIQESAPIKA
jgi:hypothetical protein